jgi:hypothetical protein
MMKHQRQMQAQGQNPQQQQQQQGNQGQGQQQPPSYQQTIDQRNQAIAQAIVDAHTQSLTESVPFGNNPDPDPVPTHPVSVQDTSTTVKAALPEQTVDLTYVWKKLDIRSTIWSALEDDQAKVMTVSEYIGRFKQEGVKINETPEHYVQMLDQMSEQNRQMLQRPFGELIQILAIIDYDFDNGMDKDVLAKKILGEAGYQANQQRIAQAQKQQQSQQQQQPHS